MLHNQRPQEGSNFTQPIEDFLAEREPIGTGTYAEILKARLKDTHNEKWKNVGKKTIAIKKIDLCLEDDSKVVAIMHAIQGELVALNHLPENSNLLRYYGKFSLDIGDKRYLCIVCEYLGGGNLAQIVDKGKSIEEGDLNKIMIDILRGLVSIHNNNMIHRDLRPENLLQDCFGRTKIIDYGFLFKITDDEEQPRSISGTMAYMSPELLRYILHSRGLLSIDESEARPHKMAMTRGNKESDIWALGIVALGMICRRDLFRIGMNIMDDDDVINQYKELTSRDFFREIDALPNLSPECKEWLKGMLSTDPKERFTAKKAFRHPWIQRGVKELESLQGAQRKADSKANGSVARVKHMSFIPRPSNSLHSRTKVGIVRPTYVTSQRPSSQSSTSSQDIAPSSSTYPPQTIRNALPRSSAIPSHIPQSTALTARLRGLRPVSVLKVFPSAIPVPRRNLNAASRSTSKSVVPVVDNTAASTSFTPSRLDGSSAPKTSTMRTIGSVTSERSMPQNYSKTRIPKRRKQATGPSSQQFSSGSLKRSESPTRKC